MSSSKSRACCLLILYFDDVNALLPTGACDTPTVSTGLEHWKRVILNFAAEQTTSQTTADITRRLGRWVEHCLSENIDPARRDETLAKIWVSQLNLLTKPGTPMAVSTQAKYNQLLRAWFD